MYFDNTPPMFAFVKPFNVLNLKIKKQYPVHTVTISYFRAGNHMCPGTYQVPTNVCHRVSFNKILKK